MSTPGSASGGAPARVPTPLRRAPAPATASSEPGSRRSSLAPVPQPQPHIPPPPPPRRTSARTASVADPLSERATTLLIRRTLCPQSTAVPQAGGRTPVPIHELLPPLTSRNDVDLQLYAVLAIVLRDFVQSWYGRITPDEDFVAEIVRIIAHCTRGLEQRLRKVDLESLLFDELPDLLDRHVEAYRIARRPIARPPLDANPREVYHSLWPTPALSPVPVTPADEERQADNETAYRHLLVQGVLAVLLPTEDLENPCLTALVGQILSELIIGGVVARKAAEPWMLYEGICIVARNVGGQRSGAASSGKGTAATGVEEEKESRSPKPSLAASLQQVFWSVMQTGFLLFGLLRTLVLTVANYRSIPSRLGGKLSGEKSGASHYQTYSQAHAQAHITKTPVFAFKLWPAVANLIELDSRMPWIRGGLSLLRWMAITGPGQLAGLDGPLDRLISHAIARHVLDASRLPSALRTLRGVLFPNNAMGKSSLVPPASDAELRALRRRCAAALYSLVPRPVARVYFGRRRRDDDGEDHATAPSPPAAAHPRVVASSTNSAVAPVHAAAEANKTAPAPPPPRFGEAAASLDAEDERIISEMEADLVDVFSDAYCNKHLMYGVVELILVRLMPELAERGIVDLLSERL